MTQAPDVTAASAALPDAAPRRGLISWIARRPDAAFGAFLAVHAVVWTALPTLLYANLPLDLIEALTYGREWVLGSDKLPPLPWWLVEIMYRVFGADIAYYALAEIVVCIAFALVYATARPLVGPARALVAVLIVDGLHYFQYTAAKFNHDVIQLPLWALAGYTFHAVLRRPHIGRWLLLGFAFGAALWAKYFVVVLAAPYLLFLVFDRQARPALRTPGPWLGIALALVIASPHLVWLIDNHFAPFAYVDIRSAPASHWWDYIWHPVFFAGGQFFFMLPALVIAAMFVWPRPAAHDSPAPAPSGFGADAFDRRIVTVIAFGPAAAMLTLIAVSGRGAVTMWGYPLWLFCGLWLVLFVPRPLDVARLTRIVIAWSAVAAALALAFISDYTVLPLLDHRYRAAFFPGDALAATLTPRFHAATGGKPLRYVAGSMWLAGNLAHYSPDQPHVVIDGLLQRSPWIDVGDMRAKGALLVWDTGDLQKLPAALAALAPGAKVGTPFTLPARRFGRTLEHVGWAILMPRQP